MTRVTALRTGEVDFANYVPREHVERLTEDAKIQVLEGKTPRRVQSFLNLRKPAFQDVRVRQGDFGLRHRPTGYCQRPPSWDKHNRYGARCPRVGWIISTSAKFAYNPDKAKALLKEVGYDANNPLRYNLT